MLYVVTYMRNGHLWHLKHDDLGAAIDTATAYGADSITLAYGMSDTRTLTMPEAEARYQEDLEGADNDY
jgi:hypothetical protein